MLRSAKAATIRTALLSVFVTAFCYFMSDYFMYGTSVMSLWNNYSPSPVSNTSRKCPDQNQADYFATFATSMGVSASK